MGWVRLHRLPNVCRKTREAWGPKERFYYDKSLRRYGLTEDGKYMNRVSEEIGRQIKNGTFEIGYVESFRFVTTLEAIE